MINLPNCDIFITKLHKNYNRNECQLIPNYNMLLWNEVYSEYMFWFVLNVMT